MMLSPARTTDDGSGEAAWIADSLWREIHRRMPILCVDVVVHCRGRGVLLVRRALEPLRGEWFLLGGRVRKAELLGEAVVRVVKEEAGLRVMCAQRLFLAETFFAADPFGHGTGTHTVNAVYGAEVADGKVVLDRRHGAWVWGTAAQLRRRRLSPYVVRAVRRAAGAGLAGSSFVKLAYAAEPRR